MFLHVLMFSQCDFITLSVGNRNTTSHSKRSATAVFISEHREDHISDRLSTVPRRRVGVDFGRLHSKPFQSLLVAESKPKSVL